MMIWLEYVDLEFDYNLDQTDMADPVLSHSDENIGLLAFIVSTVAIASVGLFMLKRWGAWLYAGFFLVGAAIYHSPAIYLLFPGYEEESFVSEFYLVMELIAFGVVMIADLFDSDDSVFKKLKKGW